jgi:hypothetical protein
MKFNAHFRNAVNEVASELGLDYASTTRQTNKGTLMFYDPVTGALYAIYESGYVRRFVKRNFWLRQGQYQGYQLNKTFTSKPASVRRTIRELCQTPEQALGIMAIGVLNYRKTLANRNSTSI